MEPNDNLYLLSEVFSDALSMFLRYFPYFLIVPVFSVLLHIIHLLLDCSIRRPERFQRFLKILPSWFVEEVEDDSEDTDQLIDEDESEQRIEEDFFINPDDYIIK